MRFNATVKGINRTFTKVIMFTLIKPVLKGVDLNMRNRQLLQVHRGPRVTQCQIVFVHWRCDSKPLQIFTIIKCLGMCWRLKPPPKYLCTPRNPKRESVYGWVMRTSLTKILVPGWPKLSPWLSPVSICMSCIHPSIYPSIFYIAYCWIFHIILMRHSLAMTTLFWVYSQWNVLTESKCKHY